METNFVKTILIKKVENAHFSFSPKLWVASSLKILVVSYFPKM